MKRKFSFLCLLIGLILSSCVSAPEKGQVSLSGTGTLTAQPDRASFDLSFRETGETTAEAREMVNAKANRALTLLLEQGVNGEDIRTTGISYYRKTRWNDGVEILIGQEAVQDLHVSLDLEDKASNLNRLIDELTSIDGLGMGGLIFEVSRTSSYREEARRLAFEDARFKAEQYALLSGRTLGKLISLTEQDSYSGRESYMAFGGKALAESNATAVQSGASDITVVIQAVFALE